MRHCRTGVAVYHDELPNDRLIDFAESRRLHPLFSRIVPEFLMHNFLMHNR